MSGATTFASFVAAAHRAGELVVQPRMGFSAPEVMRRGLHAVQRARATTVGTLTLDSYTRGGDFDAAHRAMRDRVELNGYPIVTHGAERTRMLVDGVRTAGMPVQVRHGSALPYDIFRTIVATGLDATEGGPVSYCLPYSRKPLRAAVDDWTRSCALFAESGRTHLESFGGCMMGQLCPPSLLVAITALEGLFFARAGIRSVSLSYAQQTDRAQDLAALSALRRLAGELLSDVDWHVVVYTYMGVYPGTRAGALDLLSEAATLAVDGGASRLIVKTASESRQIPSIADNVEALEFAGAVAQRARARAVPPDVPDDGVYAEARALVECVLNLHDDLGTALCLAFERGLLDVPYCLHPDNRGAARCYIDESGRLSWASVGGMPIARLAGRPDRREVGSADLLRSLSYVADKFDAVAGAMRAVGR